MPTKTKEKTLWNLESDPEFITRIYKSELGREPDTEGFKYWLDDLNIRGQSRQDVLTNIRLSEEYKQKNKKNLNQRKDLDFIDNNLPD